MTHSEVWVATFDLDDTLFPERSYAVSGLRFAARWLEAQLAQEGQPIDADLLTDSLLRALEAGVRGTIFDRVLAAHDLSADWIPRLVEQYRKHRPTIALYPEASQALDSLRPHCQLAMITDGPLVCQRAKIDALELEPSFDLVICTDRWGREHWKPAPRGYERVAHHFEAFARRCSYVGDNVEKDFVTARRLGWYTVRVERTDAFHRRRLVAPEYEADTVVSDLLEAAEALLAWRKDGLANETERT